MIGLIAACVVTFAIPQPKVNPDLIFLRAIREEETGNNVHAHGRRGELGAYQFTFATWRQHTRLPFHDAATHRADYVALAHLAYLKRWIRSHHLGLTAWSMAVAWNAGPHVLLFKIRPIPQSARRYADRVSSLVFEYSLEADLNYPMNEP